MKYENIYQHNLRLNLDKKEHLQAHRYLMNADLKTYGSKNEYVVKAILAGAESLKHPDKKEQKVITEIVLCEEQLEELKAKVVETLKAEVLNEVLKTLLNMVISSPSTFVPQTHKEQGEESRVEDYLADAAMDYFEE